MRVAGAENAAKDRIMWLTQPLAQASEGGGQTRRSDGRIKATKQRTDNVNLPPRTMLHSGASAAAYNKLDVHLGILVTRCQVQLKAARSDAQLNGLLTKL